MAEQTSLRRYMGRKPIDLGLPGAEEPPPVPETPRADPSMIPTGGLTAPAADGSQNDPLTTSELGRNVSNSLRALPGVGGIGRVASTGGAISTALNGAAGVVDGAARGAGALAAAASANPSLPSLGGGGSEGANPRGPLRIRPDDAMAGPPAPSPSSMPGGTGVTRVGNSYSGGPNITGDITVNGAAPGGGAISAQNMNAANNLAARETLRGQALAMGSSAPAAPTPAVAMNSDNSWQARNNLRNLEVSAKSITENGGRFDTTPGESPAVTAFKAAQAADIASRGGMDAGTIARGNNAAQVAGSQIAADASRYGADSSLRGQIVQAGASRANNQATLREQMRRDALDRADKDRTFTAGRNDEANRRQDEMLKSMATGPDGKVDGAKVAELRNASNAFLAQAVSAARRAGDNATADKLEREGASAIGPAEMRAFQSSLRADQIAQQQNGRLPWNGDYRATDNPGGRTIVNRENGLLTDMAVMSDGTRVPVNSLRYSGGGPFSKVNPWSVPTDEFAPIDPKGFLRR